MYALALFGGGLVIGGTLGTVIMAALCVAGMSDEDLARMDRDDGRAEVLAGFSDRLHVASIDPDREHSHQTHVHRPNGGPCIVCGEEAPGGEVLQSFPESGAHDIGCTCPSCYGLEAS